MQYYSTRGFDIDADAVVEGGGGSGGYDGCARFVGQHVKILNAGPAGCRIIEEIRQLLGEHLALDLVVPARSSGARVAGGIGRRPSWPTPQPNSQTPKSS